MVRRSMSEAVIRMLRLANLNPDTVDLINQLCDKEGVDVDGNYDLRGFTPTQKPIAFCNAVAKKCVLHLDMDSLYYAFAYSDEQLVTFEFFGTVFVKWDTGSSIGLIPEKDKFEVVKRGD